MVKMYMRSVEIKDILFHFIQLRPLDNENMKFWRSVKKSEKNDF